MDTVDRLLAGMGRRVRALRARHGYTLDELAARAGLSPRFLIEVESGKANISVRKLAGLAGALGLSPAALLAPPEGGSARPAVALLGLRADPEDHWNRVVQQGDRRPMAEHPEAMAELRRLLASRQRLYAEADGTVDTSRLGVQGTVRAVQRLLPDQAGSG